MDAEGFVGQLDAALRRPPSDTDTTQSFVTSEPQTCMMDRPDTPSNRFTIKGVIYQGMGGFDSADENQKRLRNQPKDESVIEQMKDASASVERTETIWDGIGNFQRTRDIYATPSVEGSPVSRLLPFAHHAVANLVMLPTSLMGR